MSQPYRSDRRFEAHHERRYDTHNDQTVRTKYNSIQNNNRAHTRMLRLRDFNNFIKWMQIFDYSEPHQIVLDMGCGKGGDLEKWRRAGIDGYIGVDIANVSIENAQQRYRQLEHHTFWADLVVGNCFGDDIHRILHPGALPVDTISSQFALHYAFDNIDRVRITMSNVAESLKSGGLFFGTIINSEYLSEQLRDVATKGKSSWGNDIFSISFDPNAECVKNGGKFTSLVGNQYEFYLSEAVDHIPEYVVPFDMLVDLAKEYGLTLVQREPFLQYFDRKVRASEEILDEAIFKRLTDDNGVPSFSTTQLEVCSIYLAFTFRKN